MELGFIVYKQKNIKNEFQKKFLLKKFLSPHIRNLLVVLIVFSNLNFAIGLSAESHVVSNTLSKTAVLRYQNQSVVQDMLSRRLSSLSPLSTESVRVLYSGEQKDEILDVDVPSISTYRLFPSRNAKKVISAIKRKCESLNMKDDEELWEILESGQLSSEEVNEAMEKISPDVIEDMGRLELRRIIKSLVARLWDIIHNRRTKPPVSQNKFNSVSSVLEFDGLSLQEITNLYGTFEGFQNAFRDEIHKMDPNAKAKNVFIKNISEGFKLARILNVHFEKADGDEYRNSTEIDDGLVYGNCEKGLDIYGSDIATAHRRNANNTADCDRLCLLQSNCEYFTFVSSSLECYLKDISAGDKTKRIQDETTQLHVSGPAGCMFYSKSDQSDDIMHGDEDDWIKNSPLQHGKPTLKNYLVIDWMYVDLEEEKTEEEIEELVELICEIFLENVSSNGIQNSPFLSSTKTLAKVGSKGFTEMSETLKPKCMEFGVDYYGHDIKKIEDGSISSIEECKAACKNTIGCSFFTFSLNWCYLKNNNAVLNRWVDLAALKKDKYSLVSGSVNCESDIIVGQSSPLPSSSSISSRSRPGKNSFSSDKVRARRYLANNPGSSFSSNRNEKLSRSRQNQAVSVNEIETSEEKSSTKRVPLLSKLSSQRNKREELVKSILSRLENNLQSKRIFNRSRTAQRLIKNKNGSLLM